MRVNKSKAYLFAVLPKSSAVATTYLIPGEKTILKGVGWKWIKYISLVDHSYYFWYLEKERERKWKKNMKRNLWKKKRGKGKILYYLIKYWQLITGKIMIIFSRQMIFENIKNIQKKLREEIQTSLLR